MLSKESWYVETGLMEQEARLRNDLRLGTPGADENYLNYLMRIGKRSDVFGVFDILPQDPQAFIPLFLRMFSSWKKNNWIDALVSAFSSKLGHILDSPLQPDDAVYGRVLDMLSSPPYNAYGIAGEIVRSWEKEEEEEDDEAEDGYEVEDGYRGIPAEAGAKAARISSWLAYAVTNYWDLSGPTLEQVLHAWRDEALKTSNSVLLASFWGAYESTYSNYPPFDSCQDASRAIQLLPEDTLPTTGYKVLYYDSEEGEFDVGDEGDTNLSGLFKKFPKLSEQFSWDTAGRYSDEYYLTTGVEEYEEDLAEDSWQVEQWADEHAEELEEGDLDMDDAPKTETRQSEVRIYLSNRDLVDWMREYGLP